MRALLVALALLASGAALAPAAAESPCGPNVQRCEPFEGPCNDSGCRVPVCGWTPIDGDYVRWLGECTVGFDPRDVIAIA